MIGPGIDFIQHRTADAFGISKAAMTAPSRARREARPRQVAMYLSRELTRRSLPEIGRLFGGRDHTTVLHAVRTIRRLLEEDQALNDKVLELRAAMRIGRVDGFNVLSLGEWLNLARAVRVPHVPAAFVAQVAVNDLASVEVSPQDPLRTARLGRFFQKVYAAKRSGMMMRWDHCAPGDLKAAMAQGGVMDAPSVLFTSDDPRAYNLLGDLPPSQENVPVWQRPWIDARMVGAWPVEYRVFVRDGALIGVSNYYPQRPLPTDSRTEYELRLVDTYAKAMIGALPVPLVNPQVAATGLDPAKANCSLDFIVAADGKVLFLEGGPPHTEHWGAHPCCFEGRPIAGVAMGRVPA